MTDKKHRVLIIDDSQDDIHFLMENLKDEYAILVATSGMKGIELAQKEPKPDIILLDVSMPEMSGYDTCRILKDDPVTKDIDVIFVSAHDQTDEKLCGYEAGGSDYVVKPVDTVELKQKVSLVIDNKSIKEANAAEKNNAIKTAMTAMTSAGEQGVILDFFKNSALVSTIESLGEVIVNTVAKYGLVNIVQIRANTESYNFSSDQPVEPIEKDLLTKMKDEERIMTLGSRALFNFNQISLLVKNMPEDEEVKGRYRDHIAIILDGACSHLKVIDMNYQLQKMVSESSDSLKILEQEQRLHKLKARDIMGHMLLELKTSFLTWGLTEEQENLLESMVQKGIDDSLEYLETGYQLDEKMSEILDNFRKFSNV